MNKRHEFLEQLIGTKAEEVVSYENMHSCLVAVSSCIFSFSALEVLAYFLYLFKVNKHYCVSRRSSGNCVKKIHTKPFWF